MWRLVIRIIVQRFGLPNEHVKHISLWNGYTEMHWHHKKYFKRIVLEIHKVRISYKQGMAQVHSSYWYIKLSKSQFNFIPEYLHSYNTVGIALQPPPMVTANQW